MPFYTYTCDTCRCEMADVEARIEQTVLPCPICGKGWMLRHIGAPLAQYKGTGFHGTDYPKGGK